MLSAQRFSSLVLLVVKDNYNMEQKQLKRGPKAEYDFESYPVGHEIKMYPLKQSSFKTTLSRFNKNRDVKHRYEYHQLSTRIVATRIS